MHVARSATSRLVRNDLRKDFNANTFANHFVENDSIGNVMALPPPNAVTVMISNGIIKNANTIAAQMVSTLFLRIIFTSAIQPCGQSVKSFDHNQSYNDHDEGDHGRAGPVTDRHRSLVDQCRHYHVAVAS